MKTTIEISDPLFDKAKRHAERQGTTLRALVEQGLMQVLASAPQSKAGFRLTDRSVSGEGLAPEFANAGWDTLRDAIHRLDR